MCTYRVCVYVCVLFIVFDEMEPVNHFKANIVAKIAVSLLKKTSKEFILIRNCTDTIKEMYVYFYHVVYSRWPSAMNFFQA